MCATHDPARELSVWELPSTEHELDLCAAARVTACIILYTNTFARVPGHSLQLPRSTHRIILVVEYEPFTEPRRGLHSASKKGEHPACNEFSDSNELVCFRLCVGCMASTCRTHQNQGHAQGRHPDGHIVKVESK